MKVLLVYPAPPTSHWPVGLWRSRWVPSGLASIAACLLRAGHQVRVHLREERLETFGYDLARADDDYDNLVREFAPDLVGLSAVTPAILDAGELARRAKDIRGGRVLTIVGGPHPSALPEQTLEEFASFDAAAVGEGEGTMVELADRGRPAPDIAGLVYRDGDGGVVRTAPRAARADLDELPPVPYELFNMDFHVAPDRFMIRWLKLPVLNLRTSRGCTHRCRFCAGHVVNGTGVRFHAVGRVLEEMERAVQRFGVRGIHFEDETVGARPDRMMELCDGIRRRGLDRKVVWDCCLRAEQAQPDLLRAMKDAGCIQVEYGFESGSDRSLAALGKRATLEANRRAVRLSREAGLRIFADIMVGLPGETGDDLRQTRAFLRWARPEVIGFALLAPLPGTPLYAELSQDVRSTLRWADYTWFDPPRASLNLTAMPDERFQREYKRMRRYVIEPQALRALLRDSAGDVEDGYVRRQARRRLLRFIVRHPLRALTVPW